MGFHLGYARLLRDGVRGVLAQAAGGEHAGVDMGQLRPGLERPENTSFAWQAYNCLENHDLVLDADGDHRWPRIARLAHWDDPPVLVRPQPGSGGHRPAAHRSRGPDAVHGPSVRTAPRPAPAPLQRHGLPAQPDHRVLSRAGPVNVAAALRRHAGDPRRPLATLGISLG
jgi:hypothetical protein